MQEIQEHVLKTDDQALRRCGHEEPNNKKQIIKTIDLYGTGLPPGNYSREVYDKAGNGNTCSIDIVASSCYHYEKISDKSKTCDLSSCGYCSTSCPSGQEVKEISNYCEYPLSSTPYAISHTSWECWGNVWKEGNGEFCGYHAKH